MSEGTRARITVMTGTTSAMITKVSLENCSEDEPWMLERVSSRSDPADPTVERSDTDLVSDGNILWLDIMGDDFEGKIRIGRRF